MTQNEYLTWAYYRKQLEHGPDAWRVDPEAKNLRDTLVMDNIELVYAVANRYDSVARGLGIPMEDLVSGGILGLLEAIDTFNPSLGYRLSTWAVHKIRARVQDVLGKYRHRNREMSLEEPLLGGRNNEEDALTLGEVLESQVPGPDEAFEKKKAQHFLGQVFGDLTPYLLSASPRQVSRMLRLSGYSPQELQRLAEAEGVL